MTHHVEHVPVGSIVERRAGALTAHKQLLVASLHVQVRLQALVLEQISVVIVREILDGQTQWKIGKRRKHNTANKQAYNICDI